MQWGPTLLCLWPGLARLWVRGHWKSLITAIGFAILLNLALVSSFLWPASLGETFPIVAWPMIILVWCVSFFVAHRSLTDLLSVGQGQSLLDEHISDTLFIQAQREYLRGHWTEAESLICRRLENHPRDIEARLLLATQYRHMRKTKLAIDQLDAICRFDESAPWRFEIGRERELIKLTELEVNDSELDVDGDSEYGDLDHQADGIVAIDCTNSVCNDDRDGNEPMRVETENQPTTRRAA